MATNKTIAQAAAEMKETQRQMSTRPSEYVPQNSPTSNSSFQNALNDFKQTQNQSGSAPVNIVGKDPNEQFRRPANQGSIAPVQFVEQGQPLPKAPLEDLRVSSSGGKKTYVDNAVPDSQRTRTDFEGAINRVNEAEARGNEQGGVIGAGSRIGSRAIRGALETSKGSAEFFRSAAEKSPVPIYGLRGKAAGDVGEFVGGGLGLVFGGLAGHGAGLGGEAKEVIKPAIKPFIGEQGSETAGEAAATIVEFVSPGRIGTKTAQKGLQLIGEGVQVVSKEANLASKGSSFRDELEYGLGLARNQGVRGGLNGLYSTNVSKLASVAQPAVDAGRGAVSFASKASKNPLTQALISGGVGIVSTDVTRAAGRNVEESSSARQFLNSSEGQTAYSVIVNNAGNTIEQRGGGVARIGFELGAGQYKSDRASIGGGGVEEVRKQGVAYFKQQGYDQSSSEKLANVIARDYRRSQQGLVAGNLGISVSSELLGQALVKKPVAEALGLLSKKSKQYEKLAPFAAQRAATGGLAIAGAYEGAATEYSSEKSFGRPFDLLRVGFAAGAGAATATFLGRPIVFFGVQQQISKGGGKGAAKVQEKLVTVIGKTLDPTEDFGDYVGDQLTRVKIRTPSLTDALGGNGRGRATTASFAASPSASNTGTLEQALGLKRGGTSYNIGTNTPIPSPTPSEESIFIPSDNPPRPDPTSEFGTNTDEQIQELIETPTPTNIPSFISVPTAVPVNRALGFPLIPSSGNVGGGGRGGRSSRVGYYNEFSAAFAGALGVPTTKRGGAKVGKQNKAATRALNSFNLLVRPQRFSSKQSKVQRSRAGNSLASFLGLNRRRGRR